MTEGPYAVLADDMDTGAAPTLNRAPLQRPSIAHRGVASVRFLNGRRHRLLTLAATELAVLQVALFLAVITRFGGSVAASGLTSSDLLLRGLVLGAFTLVGLYALGLYHLGHRAGFAGAVARVLLAVMGAQIAFAVIVFAIPQLAVGRGLLVITALYSVAGLATVRLAYLRTVDEDLFKRRVIVWGAGARAASIAKRLRRRSDRRGFEIVGYFNSPGETARVDHPLTPRAEPDLLHHFLRERVDEIVVAMDDRRRGFPEGLFRECRRRGIRVNDVVTFLEREAGYVNVGLTLPSWLIFSDGFRCDMWRVAVKRLFDMAAASTVLVLSAPLAILAAVAVWLEDRGPIFYRQVRTGQHGKPFEILKFRSMSVNAESNGKAVWATKNDSRVTAVGAFLRKTRIDEIPQVINVLRGDMSFVGPRPERPQFVEELTRAIPYYSERHIVKPGITGWAQIRFPYGASMEDARDKLGYDLYYVKNHSLLFDITILLQTVEVILFRVGSR